MGYRKLQRDSAHRKSLLRNLATEVIVHEKIETTEEKAKEARRLVDKLVTLGKKGDLSSRRKAASILRNVHVDEEKSTRVLQKLFDDVASRYESREGGYTRVIKKGPRRGDGANLAILELV